MKRHYYVSDDLDDLEAIELELEDNGVDTPQIHVLSNDHVGVENHHLHEVEAVLKKDVVHGTEVGAAIGVLAAALVLIVSYFSGLTETAAGWMPFIFLAIIILGFCTWEGGLFGIQEPHSDLKRFDNALRKGKHIFFVDVDENQESILEHVTNRHPRLRPAGTGAATPSWVVHGQQKWNKFVNTMP
jgi:hypothetical protein